MSVKPRVPFGGAGRLFSVDNIFVPFGLGGSGSDDLRHCPARLSIEL
jgi:hypothetical protein